MQGIAFSQRNGFARPLCDHIKKVLARIKRELQGVSDSLQYKVFNLQSLGGT